MKKVFNVSPCTKEERVVFSTRMLKGAAKALLA